MEIETAARRMLLGQSAVTGYVGQKVFKFSLLEHVEGTGGRAVVVRRNSGWVQPGRVRTSEYPLLVLDCWADCDRDSVGAKAEDNAIDKAYAVYRVIDPLIHAVRSVWWGAGGSHRGMLIVNGFRWAEPWHATAVDVHPAIQGVTSPGSPKGDSAVVTATYALQVAR
jgi:hypothetical protein